MTRVSIANAKANDVATAYQERGLSGTITPTLGFGDWGIEPGVTIELAGEQPTDAIEFATRAVLLQSHEKAAYVNTGTSAYLLLADGARKELEA